MLWTGVAQAADPMYPVAAIPAALKENAYAVIRDHETFFDVKSRGEAVYRVHYAVTVLDKRAKDYATVVVNYDKLMRFKSLSGTLYDAEGKVVERLKKSDIRDFSAFDGFSLYSDNRIKVAEFQREQYPYTVEFEYEWDWRATLFYPEWAPQDEENLAIEKARLVISMPSGMTLRYHENVPQPTDRTGGEAGDPTSPLTRKVETQDGKHVHTWTLQDLSPVKREPFSGSFEQYVPIVRTAPVEFEVDGYAGDASTWASFGQWSNVLNEGRDQLPAATEAQVKALVEGTDDPYEKIRRVYEFMQGKTRYVSIQLGIGGWQPFPASEVDAKGYGDCKALSNYTKALLRAAGITSYYTLIAAGADETDMLVDFPSRQFNHVVLCVPLAADTVWLECTSQSNPMGYAGRFTGDRHALMITPEGGKVVHTPVYDAQSNRLSRTAEVQLQASGHATAHIKTVYTGLQQDSYHRVIHGETHDEQRKWLYKRIDIPSFEINNFSFEEHKARIPEVTEALDLTVRNCAASSGKRLFLKPNLMNRFDMRLETKSERRGDVFLSMSFLDADTIRYRLPEGYKVEFLGEGAQFQSAFGRYQVDVSQEGDQIVYMRTLEMKKGQYPATRYKEFAEFCKNVSKADQLQLVLVATE
ncbi:Transglutaminase-like superfamily protein [Catalinimonas alkaloidigena]|uniref:Transglutaminase-like superfamily protein n=2 Tax=Catalinimonas alkaloidigena TaxID=1075417 RepID=A0A1G9S1W1_9BACT|nr:Transglutaminase-like superfamily protein [Catalinimonas alkaloidigena]